MGLQIEFKNLFSFVYTVYSYFTWIIHSFFYPMSVLMIKNCLSSHYYHIFFYYFSYTPTVSPSSLKKLSPAHYFLLILPNT